MKLATSIALIAAFAAVASASTLVKPTGNYLQATGGRPQPNFIPPHDAWVMIEGYLGCVRLEAPQDDILVLNGAFNKFTELGLAAGDDNYLFNTFAPLWEKEKNLIMGCFFAPCPIHKVQAVIDEYIDQVSSRFPEHVTSDEIQGYKNSAAACQEAVIECTGVTVEPEVPEANMKIERLLNIFRPFDAQPRLTLEQVVICAYGTEQGKISGDEIARINQLAPERAQQAFAQIQKEHWVELGACSAGLCNWDSLVRILHKSADYYFLDNPALVNESVDTLKTHYTLFGGECKTCAS